MKTRLASWGLVLGLRWGTPALERRPGSHGRLQRLQNSHSSPGPGASPGLPAPSPGQQCPPASLQGLGLEPALCLWLSPTLREVEVVSFSDTDLEPWGGGRTACLGHPAAVRSEAQTLSPGLSSSTQLTPLIHSFNKHLMSFLGSVPNEHWGTVVGKAVDLMVCFHYLCHHFSPASWGSGDNFVFAQPHPTQVMTRPGGH